MQDININLIFYLPYGHLKIPYILNATVPNKFKLFNIKDWQYAGRCDVKQLMVCVFHQLMVVKFVID